MPTATIGAICQGGTECGDGECDGVVIVMVVRGGPRRGDRGGSFVASVVTGNVTQYRTQKCEECSTRQVSNIPTIGSSCYIAHLVVLSHISEL
jgi:hypothetical protein